MFISALGPLGNALSNPPGVKGRAEPVRVNMVSKKLNFLDHISPSWGGPREHLGIVVILNSPSKVLSREIVNLQTNFEKFLLVYHTCL